MSLKKSPAIFPLLLYNDDKKWTAKTNIKDLISKSIPEKYIPNFSYYKIIENLLEVKNMFETALKQQQKKWVEQGIEQGELFDKQNVLIKDLIPVPYNPKAHL